jgi:hypothetical protein
MPVRDFYIGSEDDPGYLPNQVEVYDDLQAAVQQVALTVLTQQGEVLGEPNFGLDVEKYLFEFDVDPFGLSEAANSQIQTYVSEARKRKLSVSPGYLNEERERNTYVLQILINEEKTPFAILYT